MIKARAWELDVLQTESAIEAAIDARRWEKACSKLEELKQKSPAHPRIKAFEQQLRGRCD